MDSITHLEPRSTRREPLPRAIIHVGPHKTGSTAIQEFFYRNKETLLQDNFVIPQLDDLFTAHKTVANLAFCLNKKRDPLPLHCDEVFRNTTIFLDRARREKRNVILSSEEFSKFDVDLEHLSALLHGFRVETVVVYRRFYDYMRSLYFELHRHVGRERIHKILNRPTFDEWLTPAILKVWQANHAVQVRDRYRTIGQVQVYNWHSLAASEFLANFVCSLKLQNTCETAQNTNRPPRNSGYSFDPERIMAEGHRRKIINWVKLIERDDYIATRVKMETLVSQLPVDDFQYICLGKENERRLLAISKKLESQIKGNNVVMVNDLESDFLEKRQTFCSLNASHLFDQRHGEMVKLFAQLRRSVYGKQQN